MTKLTTTNHIPRQTATNKRLTLRDLHPDRARSGPTVVLADISGSMRGNKLRELQRALSAVWHTNLIGIAFGSRLFDFDDRDIGQLQTTGGTPMLAALRDAWAERPVHVVLLTDGQPTDAQPHEILQAARSHFDTPIDTVGIGDQGSRDYNPAFLSELAQLTGGRFTDVGEPIKLTETLRRLLGYRPGEPVSQPPGGAEQADGAIQL